MQTISELHTSIAISFNRLPFLKSSGFERKEIEKSKEKKIYIFLKNEKRETENYPREISPLPLLDF
jgi:hypothetical protein